VFDTRSWQPVGEPPLVSDAPALQVEWLGDTRTVATTAMDGTVSLFDVERGLLRARPLPATNDAGEGYAHLVPGTTDELVVLSGNRAGRRYPMDVATWLDEACAVVGRDLTRAEWDRYLPGRPYAATCTDRS
jgi:hypothetical protein